MKRLNSPNNNNTTLTREDRFPIFSAANDVRAKDAAILFCFRGTWIMSSTNRSPPFLTSCMFHCQAATSYRLLMWEYFSHIICSCWWTNITLIWLDDDDLATNYNAVLKCQFKNIHFHIIIIKSHFSFWIANIISPPWMEEWLSDSYILKIHTVP